MQTHDILVRGGGCVARSLALALAAQGLRVALLGSAEASRAQRDDVRSYALNAASVALLRELKVWDGLSADARTPVYEMQVQGDRTGAALDFSAWQQGVSELAFIVDAGELEAQLATALRFSPHVQIVAEPVPAALEALCEGRDSQRRAELGIRFERQPYGQQAIAARLLASEPHQGVARQWFRTPDVLALLPIDRPQAGRGLGLVWSVPDERAAELLALDRVGFEQALCAACELAPDSLQLASERAAWPLALAQADAVSGPGWVLLGDAAHVVHPLAGQGLNLGLGDVQALARVLAERESWRELGDARLLRRYERQRQLPVWAMGQVTDGLLKLFASEQAPLRELRNQGLGLLNQVTPLKRWLTRQALGL